MRDLVYYIATSLDGFIARDDGSFEDFPWDDDFIADLLKSFPETFPPPLRGGEPSRADNVKFDAVLMGRKTYQVGLRHGLTSPYPTLDQYVFSRSMKSSPDPAVTLVSDGAVEMVEHLKQQDGRSIWLCGGSELAGDLLDHGLIDQLVVKLNPVILGSGMTLFLRRAMNLLELVEHRAYPSGHVLLTYSIKDSPHGR